MTGDDGCFETGVRSCSGRWPAVPALWSYSSLKDMETCPLRWMLARAQYPELWDRPGYPQAPAAATLFGDIVHAAVEVVLQALAAAGCPSSGSAEVVAVLRTLGGYTAILEQALSYRLQRLVGNPRLTEARLHAYRRTLTERLQEARVQVQTIISRTALLPTPPLSPVEAYGDAKSERRALGVGAHPEVELVADDLRLHGRIDLLVVAATHAEITDFKTGDADPSHVQQLRTYALLWDLDRVANPTRLPTAELVIEYPDQQVRQAAPSAADLRTVEGEIADRIARADAEIIRQQPAAKPDVETCRFCQVRHLCDDYWRQVAPSPLAVQVAEWFDYEGVLTAAVGVRGWAATGPGGNGPDVLLRTAVPESDLRVGDRVRVLGVRRAADPDSDDIEVGMTVYSELHVVDRH